MGTSCCKSLKGKYGEVRQCASLLSALGQGSRGKDWTGSRGRRDGGGGDGGMEVMEGRG